MKILILKPSSLGDVVQALPVLRLLKKHLPSAEIYWWLDRRLVPLLEADPDLSGIIPFERERWPSPFRWHEAWHSLRQIRAHKFDWVLDLQSLLRSGVVAWLANGNLTLGLDDPREGAGMFYDIIVSRRSYHTHAVDWYLDALPPLNVPVHWNFQWLPMRKFVAASIREKWAVGDARWIAIQPGARWENKRWPLEYFVQVTKDLAATEPDTRFVILGSAADAVLGHALYQTYPARCLDLTGITTLPELVEWLRCSELLITNDTGPMHIAAALNKPVVALFGPTEPRRTGPYGQLQRIFQPQDLSCAPCLKAKCSNEQPLECLHRTKTTAVVNSVRRLLASTKSRQQARVSPSELEA